MITHWLSRRKAHFCVTLLVCAAMYNSGCLLLQAKERERAVEQERKALEQRVERLQKVVK